MLVEAPDLCASAPVEPSHIGGVPEEGIHATGDKDVALGLLVLHNVVEVGARCEHGHFPQELTTHNHHKSKYAEPAQLFKICRGHSEIMWFS